MGFDNRSVKLDHSDFDTDQPQFYKPNRPGGRDYIRLMSDLLPWGRVHAYARNESGEETYAGSRLLPDDKDYYNELKVKEKQGQPLKVRTKYFVIVWIAKSLDESSTNPKYDGKVMPWEFSWQTKEVLQKQSEDYDPFKTILKIANNSKTEADARFQKIDISRVPELNDEHKVTKAIKEQVEQCKSDLIAHLESVTKEDVEMGLFSNMDSFEYKPKAVGKEESYTEDPDLESKIKAMSGVEY